MSLHRPFSTLSGAVASAAVVATLTLAGCGSSDQPERDAGGSAAADGAGDAGTAGDSGDVPEECRGLYPFAREKAPDLSDVELLPDGFPEPPVDATLCETGGAGEGQEYVAYATSATAEEVLAAYEDALASYDAVRAEDGIGNPIVNASAGDVAVQVSTKDGGFSLVFTRA